MKPFLFAAAGILFFASLAIGFDSGSSYDYQTGNSYRWFTDDSGNTTINGFNTRTGTVWQNHIDSKGNQHGMDSSGNVWRYDSNTGYYDNSERTTCRGEGSARRCW